MVGRLINQSRRSERGREPRRRLLRLAGRPPAARTDRVMHQTQTPCDLEALVSGASLDPWRGAPSGAAALYHFSISFSLIRKESKCVCGSCGKRVLGVFQGAVDAFWASTAPAASTDDPRGRVRSSTNSAALSGAP